MAREHIGWVGFLVLLDVVEDLSGEEAAKVKLLGPLVLGCICLEFLGLDSGSREELHVRAPGKLGPRSSCAKGTQCPWISAGRRDRNTCTKRMDDLNCSSGGMRVFIMSINLAVQTSLASQAA